jgi:arabinogalactan endo-1,4-beta-galactosidase
VAAALRAKNLGITRIMVDFHYSDHFADPAYQDKPAAWVGHSFIQLKTDVYNHTYSVMNALKSAGITPEWAAIGNEIRGGMLWPEGSLWPTGHWSQLAQLINSGYDAVKAASPTTKVIVHIDKGTSSSAWFFDELKNNGGKWDICGLSYYPYWGGVDYTSNINSLASNMNNLASRYGKEVMVVEVGGQESNPTDTYNCLVATINKMKAVPNGMGTGVFYWEPEANSNVLPDKYTLGTCSLVSSNVLKFTHAMDAFKGGATSTPAQKSAATPTPTPVGRLNVALSKTASAQ